MSLSAKLFALVAFLTLVAVAIFILMDEMDSVVQPADVGSTAGYTQGHVEEITESRLETMRCIERGECDPNDPTLYGLPAFNDSHTLCGSGYPDFFVRDNCRPAFVPGVSDGPVNK